ncbi:MAG TPA: sigma-70 family RNA polymerase sigma factor [Rhodanobacteraceae bacterium]|nr:sigma-70 family RNA polymerase sigma factor [Rhodanobacteraceae bacterium]
MSEASAAETPELAELIDAVARGDRDAFATLYRATSARLFGVCLRMLRERREAEDALQDIYTTLWRRADSFDAARASAMTWLITLARNKCIDRLRQHRELLPDQPLDLDGVPDVQAGPATGAERDQEYRRLQECLDELEPRQQRSLREAFFSGATYNELATRCSVPLGTMKSWIRRGLLQLRTCLES